MLTNVFEKGNYSGDILTKKADEGLIASITNYSKDVFNDTLHYHVNAHFGFTIAGGFIEKKKEKYEIIPGEIIYYHAGEEHQMISVPLPSKRVNLELEPAFTKLLDSGGKCNPAAFMHNPDAKFLMVKMYKELLENDCCSMLSIQMMLLQLIHQTDKAAGKRNLVRWVKIVDDYLHEQLNGNFALVDMARAADVHPVTISKNFSRYFGCSLAAYMRKLRIEKSLSLIRFSDLSLTDIAYECGFFDQSHFTRIFKQQLGLLPNAYRKI